MSQAHYPWIKASEDIWLRLTSRQVTSLNELLEQIREYDMLELNLLAPKQLPVAVDTGIMPRIITQRDWPNVELFAQVAELHAFPKVIQLRCDCFDAINQDWYVAEMAIGRQAPNDVSIQLKASQPIKNFGRPAPDMDAAFNKLRKGLQAVHTS